MLLSEIKGLPKPKGKSVDGAEYPNIYKKRDYGNKGKATLQSLIFYNTATGEILGSKSIHQRKI